MDATELIVKALVLYSLAEHQAGHARTIEVEVEGRRFSVSDDGRGHAVDRDVDGTPYLALIYEQVQYPCMSEPGPVQLQGIGMSLVNALCSELEVSIRKADCELRLVYIRGLLAGQERTPGPSASTGNRIRGSVDPRIADGSHEPVELRGWLQSIRKTAPALSIHLNGASVGSR